MISRRDLSACLEPPRSRSARTAASRHCAGFDAEGFRAAEARRVDGTPEAAIDLLTSTLGCSPEGSFDRRLARLRKLGLIDRRSGRVWATEAGRSLVGAQPVVADASPEKQTARRH
jgi:hypothetical protein